VMAAPAAMPMRASGGAAPAPAGSARPGAMPMAAQARLPPAPIADAADHVTFPSREYRTPKIDLNAVELDGKLGAVVGREVCEKHTVVPISRAGSSLIVAMSDPNNLPAIDAIKDHTGLDVEPVTADEQAIRRAIRRLFHLEQADAEGVAGDPVVALLERQRASGLWDDNGPGDEDVRSVRPTRDALVTLLRAGVTTSHALHGAQVRKAVDALVPLAAAVAPRDPELAATALAAATLVSTGRRTRTHIRDAVAAVPALTALAGQLDDEAALRTLLDGTPSSRQ